MIQKSFCAVFVLSLLVAGAPLTAGVPDNLLEADGCDAMALVEELPPDGHGGKWLMQSAFTGKTYTYTWDSTTVLETVAADGTSAQQTHYVSWRLEEIRGAKGTNRTVCTIDLTQIPYPYHCDGQVIRGKRFPTGGIGSHGAFDPTTGLGVTYLVDHTFCKDFHGGGDD